MSNKRRQILKAGAGVAAAAAFPGIAYSQQWNSTPEKGARLRVLRWSRFVQGDIDQYMKNVQAFTAKYGIEVRVDNEGWEDVRPKAAVAANAGAGPDIILSTNDDANLYPEKLVDVSVVRGVSAPLRQEVDRRAAGLGRRHAGVPREHTQGRGLQHLPEGHGRLS